MSIVAIVVGVTVLPDQRVRLILGPVDDQPPGQDSFVVVNPPSPPELMSAMIDTVLWGGSNDLYVGETRFAERIGYTHIKLVPTSDPIVPAKKYRGIKRKY